MILLFLDCETTGLDPVIHVPWEIAAVRAEHTDDGRLQVLGGTEHFVSLSHDQLQTSTPIALKIGQFEERYVEEEAVPWGCSASLIDRLCEDKPHLVGAVPAFDDRRVGDMMRRCGVTPRWHYHLIDIEALAVGYLVADQEYNVDNGWKSDDLSRVLGVDPEKFARHTAMGDVKWCMAQYAAIFDLKVVGLDGA